MRRDEFEKLAMAELDAVFRFARFLARDADRAEELVQDVYARAFRRESIAGFSSRGGGMRAWLMTIARHSFYGRLEHERAGERAMNHLANEAMATNESSECLNASDVGEIDWEMAGTRIENIMESMSSELQEVLWFRAVEELKYRQIAELLEVPIGTVMSRLHRARTQAARLLLADGALAPQLRSAGFSDEQNKTEESDVRK